jgi:hypothetical protein
VKVDARASLCWLKVTLLALGWWFSPTCPSLAQPLAVSSPLVLRFDASAAALPQESIRAAVAQELAVPVALAGPEQSSTLTVAITPRGDLEVS